MYKYINIIILIILINISVVLADEGSGNITFDSANYSIGDYYGTSSNLTTPDYNNYSYYFDYVNPSYAIVETVPIPNTTSFPKINTASNPATLSGQWNVWLYACLGHTNCSWKAILGTDSMYVGTEPNWYAYSTSSGAYEDISLYARSSAYSYWIDPSGYNHYAAYIPAGWYYYSLLRSDMISAGGEGVWTLALFDTTDLLYSKAFFQKILENTITISFTSVPSGADVTINGIPSGTTPFSYATNSSATYNFVFSKEGYNDYPLTAHISTSTSINANLIEGDLHVSEGCYNATGIDICTYDLNGSGVYSTVPNGTGIDEILKGDGLCTTGICHASDIVEWLNRHINDLFLLTFGIVLFKAWSLKQ